MRDERIFPEPDQFIPTRYLNDDRSSVNNDLPYDPSKFVFGFGRRFVFSSLHNFDKKSHNCSWSRSCPGRYFADDLVWLSIASVLAVFDVLPSVDPESGEPILPKMEFESAAIRSVEMFNTRRQR